MTHQVRNVGKQTHSYSLFSLQKRETFRVLWYCRPLCTPVDLPIFCQTLMEFLLAGRGRGLSLWYRSPASAPPASNRRDSISVHCGLFGTERETMREELLNKYLKGNLSQSLWTNQTTYPQSVKLWTNWDKYLKTASLHLNTGAFC